VLSNLLNQPVPAAFHTGADPATVAGTYQRTLAVLALKQPLLHTHLTQRLRLAPAAFLEPLFRYLFLQTLPLDYASRVWDVFVFEGSTVLVRAAVAVLARLEPALLVYTADEVVRRLGPGFGARGAPGAGPSYYGTTTQGTHVATAATVPDSPADGAATATLSFTNRYTHQHDSTALTPFANHHPTTTSCSSSAVTARTITVTPPPSFISSASCTTASISLCPSVPPSPAPTASPTPSPSATSFPADAATAAGADADTPVVAPATPAAAAAAATAATEATGADATSLIPLRLASSAAAATTPPPPSKAKTGASGAVSTVLSVETLGNEDAFMLAVRAAGKETQDGQPGLGGREW
jgi:hypothetical protein